MTRYRVGVDVGGTFTDVVFMDEAGEVTIKKVLSTPKDYSEGILDARCRTVWRCGVDMLSLPVT